MRHPLFGLLLLLLTFLVFGHAFAQVPAIYGASAPTDFARLVLQSQGITPTTTGISTGGKILANSVPALTTASGVRIAVPVAVEATVTAAAVAGVAVKLARAASLAGWAFTGYEVYKAYQDSGLTTCAPPNFFCKSGVAATEYASGTNAWRSYTNASQYFPTVTAGCQAIYDNWLVLHPNAQPHTQGFVIGPQMDYYGSVMYSCRFAETPTAQGEFEDMYKANPTNCPTGYTLNAGTQLCTGPAGIPGPATDQELTDSIAAPWGGWTTARQKQWLDAVAKDALRSPGAVTALDLIPANSPVSITAPPVTSPASVVKTETFGNPDGSTSTRTTSETTTVTPTQSGSTMADKTLSFPSTTTQTISTINNTTNVTTTSTNVTNNASPQGAPATPADLPKDYAKETTLQKVEQDLNADTAPALPDQTAVVNTAKTANDTGITNLSNDAKTAQADHSTWFSWVWTPPIGTCAPFAGTVHGFAISWDLCPTVANIRDVLGFLLAIGAAASVYGQLFKKEI